MIVFRVSAGPNSGLRRWWRCVPLAEAARAMGVESRFIVAGSLPGGGSGVDFPVSVSEATGVEAVDELAALARGEDAVIVDDADFGAVDFARSRHALDRIPLAVIADRNPAYVAAAAFVNPNADAPLAGAVATAEARLVLGARFAPIRADIARAMTPDPPPEGAPPRLLLAAGAYADGAVWERLASLIAGAKAAFEIDAIAAPGVDARAVAEALARTGRPARVLTGEAGVIGAITGAQVAVCAARWTALELACRGVPALYASDDPHLRAMAEMGCGWVSPGGETASRLDLLLASTRARDRMAQLGTRFIDGAGAERLFEKLAKYLALPVKPPDRK